MPDAPRTAGAVFLSYAREDGEAAKRIADALRAFGVEVWFDANELRGGDAWDAKIRRQIRECALFIPIVSANTQSRGEGYFRREWKQAVDRTQDMSEHRAFIVPVITDDTPEAAADVPDQFLKAQFTRLPGGVPTAQFVDNVKRLLQSPVAPGMRSVPDAPAAAGPDPKSIAVLPFTNMSADKEQEYFSDGIAEELLNMLAQLPALRVAARTSSFFFKGQQVELREIARKLNVAHLLEGSVRKAGNRVRVTAQLVHAADGYHLWSQTWDRTLDDIFAVQDEIAAAVVAQLKITLLGGAAPRKKAFDPEAYSLFLQARQLSRQDTPAGYEQAIALNNPTVRSRSIRASPRRGSRSRRATSGKSPTTCARTRKAAGWGTKRLPGRSRSIRILRRPMLPWECRRSSSGMTQRRRHVTTRTRSHWNRRMSTS